MADEDQGMTPEEAAAFYERKRQEAEYSRAVAAQMEKRGNKTWKIVLIAAGIFVLIGIIWNLVG